MHIVNRPNDMKFFFGKFDQVVIWYLIDMHRTYRVFFLLLHVYGWNGFFLIENPIYKIFYTNQGGRSGLWWLGKIRHHYAGNLFLFPLIFSRFFFNILYYYLTHTQLHYPFDLMDHRVFSVFFGLWNPCQNLWNPFKKWNPKISEP